MELLKKDFDTYFPVNFAKFLRTPFLTEQILETASAICDEKWFANRQCAFFSNKIVCHSLWCLLDSENTC